LVLATLALLCVVAAYSARRIEIRFAFRNFFDYPANPDVATIDRYHAYFEDPAGFVAIVVESKDVFDPPTLAYVTELTRALEPDAIFSHVRSVANARAIRWVDDSVDVGQLVPHVPTTVAGSDRLRAIARDSRLIHRLLVSEDSRAALIAAQLAVPPSSSTLPDLRHAIAVVNQTLAAHPPPPGMAVRVTGAPTLEVEASDALVSDQLVFTPIAILLIVVALWLAFRCMHGVVLPMVAISIAAIWTAGIYPWFGRPIDMVASTIPATLLVYGAVDPIFVLRRYLDKLRAGLAKEDAIIATYRELTMPCLLSSLTTAVGFAAFATLELPIIVNFGAIMAIGVMLAFATTMVVLPVLLAILPVPSQRAISTRLATRIDRMLAALWRWLSGHRRAVLIVAVALIAGGALFASTRQTVSVYYTRILPPGSTEKDIRFLEREFVGVIRSAVFMEGPKDIMKQPKTLRAIEKIGETAASFPIVTAVVSVSDMVREMNRAFMEGDPKELRIPDSLNLSAQYLQMLDPEDRQRLVSEDEARSHIMIFSRDQGTAAWRPMRDKVMAVAKQELEPLNISVHMTEQSPAGFDALDRLVYDVLWGFVVAFGLVLVLIAVIMRSPRIAVLSAIPNLVPVVACFVLLAVFGITLRVGTVLFLSVSVGGLFNTTIQLVARLRQRIAEDPTLTPDAAIDDAMRDVGPPALFTAVILALGFAIFGLSRFPDLRVFGLLASTTLVVAFVSDMMLSTTLLRVFFRWRRT
jgi:predicted RND superfamily exporter protein